jgi:hypothetical protein
VHLEIKQVIPAAATQLYTQQQKDNARWWRDQTGAAAIVIGGYATLYCAQFGMDRTCAAGTIAGVILAWITNHFGNIVMDPWDDYYQWPFDPIFYDASAYGWGYWGDPNLDPLVYAGTIVAGYTEAANITINRASSCLAVNDGCVWWQLERLSSFQQITGSWTRYAAEHLAWLRDRAVGEGHHDAYDPFNRTVSVLWGAGEFLEQQ